MIDSNMKHYEKRVLEMQLESLASERKRDEALNRVQYKLELEMKELEFRFEKKYDQIQTLCIITIFGSLIVLMNIISLAFSISY